MRPADFTLTAGPAMASPRVLAALGSPIIYHYDPVFLDRFTDTERLLAQAYCTTGDVVLMQGEAVLGLEAAVRGLARPGIRCLNLVSGVYGSSLGERLRECGAIVHEVRAPYNEAIDPAAVEDALDRHRPIELVSIVHSETPSGIENPLQAVCRLAHQHGALVLSDAVSSLGAATLLIDDWNIDVAVASAQKCIAGPPGIALLSVSKRAWEVIESNPAAPRGSFLSLLDWKHRWIDGGRGTFPHTPSTANIAGVHAALSELLEDGGIEESIARHARAARATRAGVQALGLQLWPRSETYAASCVTAVSIPTRIQAAELLAHIRQRYGVMLSGSHRQLRGNIIRLGHMGPASRSLYPLIAVAALGRGLADYGTAVDLAAGAQAVLDTLADTDQYPVPRAAPDDAIAAQNSQLHPEITRRTATTRLLQP